MSLLAPFPPLLFYGVACLHPLVNPSIPRESIDFLASYEASDLSLSLSRNPLPFAVRSTIAFPFDRKGIKEDRKERKSPVFCKNAKKNTRAEERELIIKRNANKRTNINNNTEKRV